MPWFLAHELGNIFFRETQSFKFFTLEILLNGIVVKFVIFTHLINRLKLLYILFFGIIRQNDCEKVLAALNLLIGVAQFVSLMEKPIQEHCTTVSINDRTV